jgi:hypothetical protein
MIMLGVIGEYLWRSYHETRKLPNFVVEAVVEAPEDGDAAAAEP